MNKRGILKYKQTKKYVLCYIFYNEEPIYVGVSNNFKSRRGQHFNERYIENMNSSLSKYIGLRLLFGADYENDILQEIEEHDYEVYSLLDCFLPSSEKEGLFVWKICILRKEKDMIMI